METVLITGANRGIGLELTRQALAKGWFVHACYRNLTSATELAKMAEQYRNKIQLHLLDVTDNAGIASLAQELKTETIDILFNNAGVYGPHHKHFGDVPVDEWLEVFKTNSIAPLMLAQALINNIACSKRKLIINISSTMGSMVDNSSGGAYIYRSSKTALNAVTKSMAVDLKSKKITVLALHPGWVLTEMGGPHALITPEESAKGILKVVESVDLNVSGSFLTYKGENFPW